MKTELGTELALKYRLEAIREIRDWAATACDICERNALDNTNAQDYMDDCAVFEAITIALEPILRA